MIAFVVCFLLGALVGVLAISLFISGTHAAMMDAAFARGRVEGCNARIELYERELVSLRTHQVLRDAFDNDVDIIGRCSRQASLIRHPPETRQIRNSVRVRKLRKRGEHVRWSTVHGCHIWEPKQ